MRVLMVLLLALGQVACSGSESPYRPTFVTEVGRSTPQPPEPWMTIRTSSGRTLTSYDTPAVFGFSHRYENATLEVGDVDAEGFEWLLVATIPLTSLAAGQRTFKLPVGKDGHAPSTAGVNVGMVAPDPAVRLAADGWAVITLGAGRVRVEVSSSDLDAAASAEGVLATWCFAPREQEPESLDLEMKSPFCQGFADLLPASR